MTGVVVASELAGEVLGARGALADGLEALRNMLTVPMRSGSSVRNDRSVRNDTVRSHSRPYHRTREKVGAPSGGVGTVSPTVELERTGNRTAPTPGSGGPAAPGPDAPDESQRPEGATGDVWPLVQRAQAGDTDAFGQLYDRYVDTVFRYVYFRVGSRPLAEDLTSETFLRALRRISSFTWQGRDLGAWLVTIARNLVADHFKSGRYRLEIATDVLDTEREDRGLEGSPEAAVLDRLTNATLLAAVKKLNPEQQECIVLRFLQSFSVAETARTMGKNEGAIKALQYRAVRALARLLPDGFQP